MTETAVPRLAVRNLDKSFGRNRVLRGVELEVAPGEIHGLVGENGSGKSTLVKILSGYHICGEAASIEVDGAPLALPVRWEAAHSAGVSVVHQDFGLIDDLSVAENIGVGGYSVRGPFRTINWARQRQVATEVLSRLGAKVDPAALVGSLPAVQRAEVAIARALRDLTPGSGLLILDESTRSLTREEMACFYSTLRPVVEEGTAVLVVSHNLEEVLSRTDRVTVLRDGEVAGSGLRTAEVTERELAHRMLGRQLVVGHDKRPVPSTKPRVVVRGLGGGGLSDFDLEMAAGEIVGITGLSGSGFESLPYLLAGVRRADAGTLSVDGATVELRSATVRRCAHAGVALVPERRDRDGLALDLSMQENLTLPLIEARAKRWYCATGWQKREAAAMARDMGVRPAEPSLLLRQFSGGNQQKILLGKWLAVGPRLLILHEPTQAVDVGARQDLLGRIHRVAESGVSVLLVSIEATDLAAVCHRVLVHHASKRPEQIVTDDPDLILETVYTGASAA